MRPTWWALRGWRRSSTSGRDGTAIWQKHRDAYARLTERYHEPLSKTLFDTEIYLKLPSSGYLGRGFSVFLEPMGAPSQVNARNYGSEYYVVISPSGSELKMDQIRHTYLHYLLDPLSLKYPTSMKRLEPLLESVKGAPMEESFKIDTSLLVTECLVRAVEIRMQGNSKTPEALRTEAIDKSTEQGFILTRYFYDSLAQFEKDPEGIRNAYIDLLNNVDVKKEQKRAADTHFAAESVPDVLHFARPKDQHLLVLAEKRLLTGDLKTSQELAEQALHDGHEDAGPGAVYPGADRDGEAGHGGAPQGISSKLSRSRRNRKSLPGRTFISGGFSICRNGARTR